MRLLFIHEVNYETKVIFEIQEFPELLALHGNQVDFLQFQENIGIKKISLRTKTKKISGRVYRDAQINLISPPTLGGSFFDRLLTTISIIPTLWTLISRKKYDAVILYAVPTSGWQAAIIARIKGVPIIFRALDVSHLLRSGLTKKLVQKAEVAVYRNVNLISANNLALAEYCQSISDKKIQIAVNFPPLDLSHFGSLNPIKLQRSEYGLKESDFVLAFMGTFYEFSGLDKMITELAKINFQDVKLLLIGSGVQEDKLRKLVKESNLSAQVIFTGVVGYDLLPQVLRLADVAFNSFEPLLVSNVAFPHKVLQYLATGIPTISTKLHGLYSALQEEAGVFWVDKPEQILSKARELKTLSNTELESITAVGKNFVKSNFEKFKSAHDLEETIKKVIVSTSE